MSLRPDDRASRGRSKSATRDRSRSRSNVAPAPRAPSPPAPNYGYAPSPAVPASSTMPGGYGNGVSSPNYEVRTPDGAGAGAQRPGYYRQTSAPQSAYPPQPPAGAQYYPHHDEDDGFTMGDYKDFPPHERPGYVPPAGSYTQAPTHDQDRDLAYGDSTLANGGRQPSYNQQYPSHAPQQPYPPPQQTTNPSSAAYKYTPNQAPGDSRTNSYNYQYAQPPDKIAYTATPHGGPTDVHYTSTPAGQFHEQLPRTYAHNAYDRDAHVVDITPRDRDRDDRRDWKPSGSQQSHRMSTDARQAGLGAPATSGLMPRMDRLSVSGNRPDLSVHSGGGSGGGGALPPPSPLLEAYHGTYQQISPMPLAIRPDDNDDDLSDMEPLSTTTSRSGGKAKDKLAMEAEKKKRVKLYDPEEDAKAISDALKHRKVDADALVDVLPGLSHDQIMELRKEYKKQVKVQGKGVNLPKHLKTKLEGNFGKVTYVTALGRWESEGYWANFWYQSHSSRRELLIESLMGRTNAEIWNIKDEFRDKRYADSLVRCMEKELKMDKFRSAVLMVLEERRQEEQDVYPVEYRNRDVDTLRRALTAKQGGESAMLEIIVRRSDAHLREVLKTYEHQHGENFPRAALKKSNNLVGEVIAHILNGVINKPARDALLLQHALNDIAAKNKDDELRYELLVSRLVRLHWDRTHLERVKRAYAEKYRKRLEDEIEDATRGEFADFLVGLCEGR